MKEVKIIIRINRKEMEYLVSHGVGYHENGIISTTGHHRAWYMTESGKNKSLLKKCRDNYVNI